MNDEPWLDTQSIPRLVNHATWLRGLAIFGDQQNVTHLFIEPIGPKWLVLGKVQGSQLYPYNVSIELTRAANGTVLAWHSECDCPMESKCKHCVALLLMAAEQGLSLSGPAAVRAPGKPIAATKKKSTSQTDRARAQAIAQAQAESRLLQWLQDMDVANGTASRAPVVAHRGYGHAKPPKPEQFLYLLSVMHPDTIRPRLQMQCVVSYVKQNGLWSKPRALRHAPYRGQPIYDNATPADHEVQRLLGIMLNDFTLGYSYNLSRGILHGEAGLLAMKLTAGTGRLFLDDGHGAPGRAVQWCPPQSLQWQWQESKNTHNTESAWALRTALPDAEALLCMNDPPLYLNKTQGRCGPVEAAGIPPAQLTVLLNAPAIQLSALKKYQGTLMQHLGPLPPPPGVQALKTMQGVTPTACLHLSPAPPAEIPRLGLVLAQLQFDYQGQRGWWTGQGGTVLIDHPTGNILLHRDVAHELDAVARLSNFGLRAGEHGCFHIPGDASQQPWLRWADEAFAALTGAGFEVTLDDALKDWISHAGSLSVQMQAQGDDEVTSPWFDLSLGMEINGRRHNILPFLPALLEQMTTGASHQDSGATNVPPFIYLRAPEGNGYVRLPTAPLKPWLTALLELVGERAHNFSGDSLKLSRFDALRTSASLGEGALWEGAKSLRKMLRQLGGRSALPDIPVPRSVLASLRPYQQQGLNWLQFLREYSLGGILADDMGLGKTLQTLVHIQVEKDAGRLRHPALIIAPVSLMGNWQREAARFCPQLRSLVLHGKERHQVADTIGEHDLVIVPYSLLQRDRERWLATPWHMVVLDEAQNIKNASTFAAQVVGQLQTAQRLCLSGTPMENHLGELWSLFHFLMPGFLGSQKRFATLFRAPIEKHGDPERLEQLRARITPFMLRRTKSVVATELPPKVETVMRVELSGKQADLYETIRLGMEKTVREALQSKGLARSQITILDALLKLRQVCCAPQLVPLAAAKTIKASAKLEQLMEMLPEMLDEGRRILLFSQFTSMLTLIEAELEKRKLSWVKLTGQSQKRDAIINRFTSGQVPLFLISLKAGGVGLNLPQADTVIHYDPWWNPAVENQATDRAHRIGQTQSVWVVKLVAQGTIEERILALQERKAALANSMYSGATGRKQPLFSENDLAELLKPLAAS